MANINLDQVEKLIVSLYRRYYEARNIDRTIINTFIDDALKDCGLVITDDFKVEPILEGLKTEFQKQVSCLIASVINREHDYTQGYVEWVAQSILGYAKNELKPVEYAKGEDYGIDGLYAAIDILQKTLGKVKGYQSDDGILSHKCAITAVKELSEQKHAEWSEEDKTILALLQNCIGHYYADGMIEKEQQLKLEERLKSLHPQKQWKPSKEQLYWLKRVIQHADTEIVNEAEEVLTGLYEQLKAL